MIEKYNGFSNWARWNIALWVNNDEGLYNLARDMMRQHRNIHKAAAAILESLHELGITKTPDGARYSRAALVEALRDWQ